MQLIRALLIAVSVVVLLSGVSIFFGSPKQEKSNAARFLLTTFGAVLWTIAIAIFIQMPDATPQFAQTVVTCIICGITICDIGLLAYLSWPYKYGKFATILYAIVGIVLVALMAYDPGLFYTSIDLNQEYTHLFLTKGWYYYVLFIYFTLISLTFFGFLLKRIKKTTNRGTKTGLKIFYAGLSISGVLVLVFNLILITSHPHLTWIGPMSTSLAILSFYYSIVKFRTISMSSKWMEVMSYVIIIVTGVIIYLLVFYAVFNALFGIPNPSGSVLMLNVVMAAFLLLLMPTLSELTGFMRASFYVDRIELGYITKKLEGINKSSFDPRDIVKFLADSMHYSYILLVLNGHLYSSDNSKFSADEISQLANLKLQDNQIWAPLSALGGDISKSHDISRIGNLTDKNGKSIGKIVFGKRIAEGTLSRRDLVKHEAIIGVLSAVAEENIRKR